MDRERKDKCHGSQGIVINNEFYVIGGYNDNKHLKWNKTSNKFEVLHDLHDEISTVVYKTVVR